MAICGEELIFFRDAAPGQLPIIYGSFYIHPNTGSTKWVQWVKGAKKEHMKNGVGVVKCRRI